jgi:uracil-DNA glycosylase family 4
VAIKRVINIPGAAAPAVQKSSSNELALGLVRKRGGIYPLDAPGLQPLKPDSAFVRMTSMCGDGTHVEQSNVKVDGKSRKVTQVVPGVELPKLINKALYDPDLVLPIGLSKTQWRDVKWLPGQLWDTGAKPGPQAAEVMIVSKTVGHEDRELGFAFSGSDGQLLRQCFQKIRAPGVPKYYVTYLNKFSSPKKDSRLLSNWVSDGIYLLFHELMIVRPKYILCLGADALQALMGKDYKITAREGEIMDFTYDVRFSTNDNTPPVTAKLMTVINPRQVARDPAALRQLETGIHRFATMVNSKGKVRQTEPNHSVVDNISDLFAKLKQVEKEPEKRDSIIAVDAEWHGAHPCNEGSYVRTIQMSWLADHALCIKLHEAGGALTDGFAVDGKLSPALIRLLNIFFKGGTVDGVEFRRKRVVGHFFNADLEWLIALGVDIQECFKCPLHDLKVVENSALSRRYIKDGFKLGEMVPAWYRTKYEGGADTGLMDHAIEESSGGEQSGGYGLSTLALRYTTLPRYDKALIDWKTAYCKSHGISSKALEGYGDCPDDILIPYGNYDADATLQLYYALEPLLDCDYEQNSCREAFWESQIATPGVLEIHTTGLTLNKQRVEQLYQLFSSKVKELREEIAEKIRWPAINFRSVVSVREWLFGHELNGKLSPDNKPVRTRPDDAVCFNLEPSLDGSKPPKRWADIPVHARKDCSPTTSAAAIALLLQDLVSKPNRTPFDEFRIDILQKFTDLKYLDQVIKTVLRPPKLNDDTEEFERDDLGDLVYETGLASYVCDDGRIRTHVYQTKETGRWATARPNLQNMAKKREDDYVRIFGKLYEANRLRSVLRAREGCVLLEVDYIGAELFGMAVLSGDKRMIEHVRRNQLPEDHPDYYDIHSHMAVSAFQLKCPPTKKGLKDAGKATLRIIAKSILFGLAYGRGAAAISLEAKLQGFDMSVFEAQNVIDTIFRTYPKLQPFFREAKMRATGQWADASTGELAGRFLCNNFGRYRRFPTTTDRSLIAEFERQAMNFPLQSLVASAVSRAVAYLMDYKTRHEKKTGKTLFRLLLQIHDALLLEVPYENVKFVAQTVVPNCMRLLVPIFPTDLGGMPKASEPYYLGVDGEVMYDWGHKITRDWALERGLPVGTYSDNGVSIAYTKD